MVERYLEQPARPVKMPVLTQWYDWFAERCGGQWPDSYLSIDLETSGFDRSKDVILEVGHVLRVRGRIESEMQTVLDWTDHPIVSRAWLEQRLNRQRQNLELAGKHFPFTIELLQREGRPPEEVMRFYADFLATLIDGPTFFVGHNIIEFDEPMLEANLVGFGIVQSEFSFGDRIIDTMSLEKANRVFAGGAGWVCPKASEDLRTWSRRVRYAHTGGLKYNLTYCVETYKLAEKYGFDPKDMHRSLLDARVVGWLMEEFRGQMMKTDKRRPLIEQGSLFNTAPEKKVPAAVPSQPVRRRGQRNS